MFDLKEVVDISSKHSAKSGKKISYQAMMGSKKLDAFFAEKKVPEENEGGKE